MTEQKSTRAARVTVPELRRMKERGERIAVVTAYDATFSRMLDEGGADVLLVGDSLGMVVQGPRYDAARDRRRDELSLPRAVARGARRALVIGDMPFMSYQVSAEDALRNAGRFLSEGGAHAVKLEGGEAMAPTIARLVNVGIPVMAHVGLTPQSVHAMGGFKVQGRGEEAERVFQDALAVQAAGAFSLVLEGIPSELAARITAALDIPTIGIGAGPECDGQVLVCYDLLGLTPDLKPKFVKRYAELFDAGRDAMARYVEEVREKKFPSLEHSFGAAPRGATATSKSTVKTSYGPERCVTHEQALARKE